jgi:hypothetical protein
VEIGSKSRRAEITRRSQREIAKLC